MKFDAAYKNRFLQIAHDLSRQRGLFYKFRHTLLFSRFPFVLHRFMTSRLVYTGYTGGVPIPAVLSRQIIVKSQKEVNE